MTNPETYRRVARPLMPLAALCLALLAAALTPASAEAQCAGCKFYQGEWVCGDNPVDDPTCQGASGYECEGCHWEYATIPTDLTPAGALYRAAATGSEVAPQVGMTTEVARGVTVLRSACSGAITERFYSEAAAERARKATARLVLQ